MTTIDVYTERDAFIQRDLRRDIRLDLKLIQKIDTLIADGCAPDVELAIKRRDTVLGLIFYRMERLNGNLDCPFPVQ